MGHLQGPRLMACTTKSQIRENHWVPSGCRAHLGSVKYFHTLIEYNRLYFSFTRMTLRFISGFYSFFRFLMKIVSFTNFDGFSPLGPIVAARQPAMLPCCRIGRRGAQACDHRFSICKAARQPAFKLFAASIFFPKKITLYFGFRVIH